MRAAALRMPILILALLAETGEAQPRRVPDLDISGAAKAASQEPQADLQDAVRSRCPRAWRAAAYICCDDHGRTAVCSRRELGRSSIGECIAIHEAQHLLWFARNIPDACRGRTPGSCEFQMTVGQFQELECAGYRAELRCLRSAVSGASDEDISEILRRQRALQERVTSELSCPAVSPRPP